MIAGALWLLDRLPARVRGPIVLGAGLLAVGALLALMLLAPAPGPPHRPRAHSRDNPGASTPDHRVAEPITATLAQTTTTRGALAAAPAPTLAASGVAGRRFLVGYLAYAYRDASPAAIADLTPTLRRALAAADVSVAPAARRRHPTVRNLQVTLDSRVAATAVVTIVDRTGVSYPLTLQLQRRDGRWQVASLGDD